MKSKIAIAVLSAIALAACTRVDSGQVGVERNFSGEFQKEPLNVGWHSSFTSTIYAFSVREIPVKLNDLRPTTKNNSSVLKDLDVEIQYSVNPSVVPELAVKYVNMHMDNPAGFLPAYQLVEKQAKSVVADAVSQFDVLSIASKRNELEGIIMKNLQSDLDKNDPNTFTVSRVTISNLLLDDRIQSSIQQIAESENQKQVALNKLEIAKTQALENQVRSQSLDGKILAEKQLDALVQMGQRGNIIVVPVDFKGNLNIPVNTNTKPIELPKPTPAQAPVQNENEEKKP